MTLRRWREAGVYFLAALSIASISWSDEGAESAGELLDMSPESPAPWGLRYLSAPLVSVVRGSDYMYSAREIVIHTTPAGGYLDLFYVRSGFQKRFEQAESPLTVCCPPDWKPALGTR